jgi:hypothetical protein
MLLRACAKEVANVHLRINKQFVTSGSCCVVDFEQWTVFKGAASRCLSYCCDTNLGRVQWFTTAGI